MGGVRQTEISGGRCFQEFTKDPFAPTRAVITNYTHGEMLHEAAIGIADAHFTNDNTVVKSFTKPARSTPQTAKVLVGVGSRAEIQARSNGLLLRFR